MICKHKWIWFIMIENGEGTTKDTVQLPVHHWLQEEGPLPLIFPSQTYKVCNIQQPGVNV